MSPPLVPAGESPAQPAPRGEVFPREQKDEGGDGARFAGRLILQPPAGILAGAVGAVVGFYPALGLSALFCEAILDASIDSTCFDVSLYSGTALSASIGAGVGVLAVGHLLGGKARVGATIGGALAGSAVGGAIVLFSGAGIVTSTSILLVAPALGATVGYALSDAFFPDSIRAAAPADEDEDEDEYVWVLPMVSATQTGGIIGGLVGRF